MLLVFCTVAALLIAAAWLFVLPPLVRPHAGAPAGPGTAAALAIHRERRAELDAALARGELGASQHAKERAELERRVADECAFDDDHLEPAARMPAAATAKQPSMLPPLTRSALALGLLLPALAIAVYAAVGRPAVLLAPEAGSGGAASASPEATREVARRIAARLQREPNDAGGWRTLARAHAALGRFAEAAGAFERALSLAPADAELLADYASTLAEANGRNLEGRPLTLVEAALGLDARHPKSLALAGAAAYNRGDWPAAIGYWRRLQAVLPPDSGDAQRVAAHIAEAQRVAAARSAPARPSAAGLNR